MADGYQRALTELEEETLFLWRAKVIHLPAPPSFISETHTLKERLALIQIHVDHMGFKLYVATPARLKWPAATAKYHFCASLVEKKQTDGCTDGQVLALLKDVHLFTCSADSHLAILRFVRPDVRDKWTDKQFQFPFGKIKLRATDTFEQEDKNAGLDAAAVDMLYPIHLLGHPTMPLTDVHELARQVSGGLPILDIVPIEPTGARTLDDHVWSIHLNSMEAPPGLDHVRCLEVTQGERVLKVGVHLPRAATRPPCSVCLGVDHFRNKCPNREKASELRASFVKTVTIAATSSYAVEPVAATLEEHRAQMARLRQTLAPELVKVAAPPPPDSPPDVEREPAQPSSATAATPMPANQTSTNARQMNSAQIQTITRAIGRSKGAHGSKTRSRMKRGTQTQRLVGGKLPQPVEPWAGGAWQLTGARPGHKHTRDDGQTKERAFRAAEDECDGAMTGLAPGRQAKSSAEHGSIDRRLPEPPHVAVDWAPPGGVRDQNHRPRFGQLTLTPFCRTVDPHADDAAQPTGQEASPGFTLIGVLPAPTTLTMGSLLSDIGARQVATPANGSCLFHAFVAAQSRECGTSVDGTDKIEIKLADQLRSILYELLRDKLVEFLYTASLTLQDLREDHLDPKDPFSRTKAVPMLQQYFDEASRLSSATMVPRKYWGGDAVLAAFVRSTTEPAYILSVDPDGATAILRYALMPVHQSDGSKLLRVVRQAPTPEIFRAQLDVYKRHKVVPVLLILTHSVVNGTHSSHYTVARLADAFYKECVGTLRVRGAMLLRLPRVIAEIDDMNTHGSLPAPRPAPTPGSPDTSSVYEPSSATSADSAGTGVGTLADGEPVTSHAASTGGSDVPAAGDDGDVSMSGRAAAKTATASPLPVAPMDASSLAEEATSASTHDKALESILFSQPEPSMSYDSLLRCMPISPVTPQTPLAYADECELLVKLQRAPPYDDQLLVQLKKATSPNKTALGGFMQRLATDQPALLSLIRHAKNPAAACLALQDHPSGMRQLVRATPYPEVLVALLDDSILIRAGRVAVYLGRLQMLHRLQAILPKKAASFCHDWARRIHASPLPDGKWLVAQEAHTWQKLQMHTEKQGISIPERVPGGLPDAAWCRLVAYLLLVPTHVPNSFAGRSFPVQCDALLAWASRSANAAVFAATALTLAQRQWLSAGDVRAHWKQEWEPSQADDDMSQGSVVGAAQRH